MADYLELGEKLHDYCQKYKIPIEYIFEILNDQKVVPMIRGKASEYNAHIEIISKLNNSEWYVQKLNLNAQTGTDDEDISITHRRTGIIITVECKNAVRGSMKSGKRSRKIKVPNCQIKCHRSRSNLSLAGEGGSNDRYHVNSFDIIIANLSNAIIKGATYGENFELIDDEETIKILADYYGVEPTFSALFDATSNDWRFALSKNLAEGDFIPRTPYMALKNNSHWNPLEELESVLLELVKEKMKKKKKK